MSAFVTIITIILSTIFPAQIKVIIIIIINSASILLLIISHRSQQLQYSMFYVLWSLKEAFVKAVGQGLGFNLLEVGCYS